MDAQEIIARRIARELRSGMLVNLGIGIPTLVTNYLPTGINVFFQSENGLIGTGPVPEPGMGHPTLTDAAGRPVTALPGACTFDSAMSFGLIRVAMSGRLANDDPQLWNTIDERFLDPRYLPDEWDDPEHPFYRLPRPLGNSSTCPRLSKVESVLDQVGAQAQSRRHKPLRSNCR
jgi:Coenzyme A transferase